VFLRADDPALADVDRDGRTDVVISHSELPGFPLAWYEAADPGNGPWIEHVVRAVCDYCRSLHVADFNANGRTDILTGGMHTSRQ
jgi:hypothetical protein